MTQEETEALVERLQSYRPTNEWGEGVHHVICDEAASALTTLSEENADLTRKLGVAGWQLIETAPKDGTEFLSYGGPDNVHGKVQPTRWLSPGPFTTENGKNSEGQRRYQWPDGFYWAGYDGFVGPVSPTVWMPLPDAPASNLKGEHHAR